MKSLHLVEARVVLRLQVGATPLPAVGVQCNVETDAHGEARVALRLHVARGVPGTSPPDWVCYTDGGYSGGAAGWAWVLLGGAVDGETDAHATVEEEAYGPVVVEMGHPAYIGATKHTNNTGEITALAEQLRALLEEAARPPASRGIIRPDSEFAAACMLGRVSGGGEPARVL